MTTCPSGVHYMHLVDEARAHVEETYRSARCSSGCCATCLAYVMPRPGFFRLSLIGAKLASPLAPACQVARRNAASPRCWGSCPAAMPTPEPFGQPGTLSR